MGIKQDENEWIYLKPFFICEKNYGKTKYNKFLESYINKKNKYSRNRIMNPPDFYNNFNSYKNFNLMEEIKSPEERIKDFFMFLNTIFIKDNYNNLKYDENEIFGHKNRRSTSLALLLSLIQFCHYYNNLNMSIAFFKKF